MEEVPTDAGAILKGFAATLDNIRQHAISSQATAVIRCSEALSAGLRLSLEVSMRHSDHNKIAKRLFEGYGPLNNFRSRLDLAYALEIIDKTTYDEMTLLNKVRVKFAHALDVRSFSDKDIIEVMSRLEPAGKKPETPGPYIDKSKEISRKLQEHFDATLPTFQAKSGET